MRRLALAAGLLLVSAACSDAGPAATSAPTATATTATTTTAIPATTAAEPTTTGPDSTGPPEPAGAQSLGDPYFPDLGNGGYDVIHYDIEITVDPESAALDAVTTITAVADETLATFNLDFVGLEVSSLMVDGSDAEYVRQGPELRISPDGGIVAGEEFTVTVAYSGRPQLINLISAGVQFGWLQTPEGIYVVAEPDGARTWFPSNDHPTDKATFTFRITVPKPLTAAANGALVETIDNGDSQTFVWDLDSRMATFLATLVIGEYERFESEGPEGILIRDYLPTSFNGKMPAAFEVTAEAMVFLAEWFGPFPFDRYGHIVVYELGGALENQTLSLMGSRALFDEIVVHELAHQWWGDSVTPASWQDIWLSEGFATFAEFLWTEHLRGEDAMNDQIEGLHGALQSIGHFAISDPRESQLFGPAVYWRGGMVLHALRAQVGDEVLKEIFHTYFEIYADGNVTTREFIDLAEEISGQDLTELFDAWLFAVALPDLPDG
ncbi:MAG: M1 family metallopeptidase [Acidobacteria bacterium]|nr:M1 family metallopeptidase [Acidobacteriota bacterium]